MHPHVISRLLPEEDAIDDLDDDDEEPDTSVPGDLWFRTRTRQDARGRVVYFRTAAAMRLSGGWV